MHGPLWKQAIELVTSTNKIIFSSNLHLSTLLIVFIMLSVMVELAVWDEELCTVVVSSIIVVSWLTSVVARLAIEVNVIQFWQLQSRDNFQFWNRWFLVSAAVMIYSLKYCTRKFYIKHKQRVLERNHKSVLYWLKMGVCSECLIIPLCGNDHIIGKKIISFYPSQRAIRCLKMISWFINAISH